MRINAGLFKGKATTTGKWLYGSLLKVTIKDCPIWIIFEDNFDITGDIVKAMSHACVDPDTLGECTGLTDKNGKLIFEGDITKHEKTGTLAVVRFGQHMVYDPDFILRCCGFYFEYDDSAEPLCYTEETVIIGNIHDNPELLKGGEG